MNVGSILCIVFYILITIPELKKDKNSVPEVVDAAETYH